MYEPYLVLDNLQWLICYKNQTEPNHTHIHTYVCICVCGMVWFGFCVRLLSKKKKMKVFQASFKKILKESIFDRKRDEKCINNVAFLFVQ